MTLLSIAIPHSARRLVPSAPASAHHLSSTMLPASVVPSAVNTPAVPGLPTMQQMHEISATLSGLTSLEELLTALRARSSKDKQIALEHFREVLHKEGIPKFTPGSMPSVTGAGLLSDALTSKLTAFASLDEVEAKWAVVTAIDEILKVHMPDKKTAARLELALFRIIPCMDIGVAQKAAQLYSTLTPLDGMSVMAESQCQTMLEWLEADSRSDRKRLGAVIFLTEIFRSQEASQVVKRYTSRAVHTLWDSALQDHKIEIREAGKLALEACVTHLAEADKQEHRHILLEDTLSSLNSFLTAPHAVHGALLTACVLAKTSGDEASAIQALWPAVLRVKDRDGQATRATMEFITIAADASSSSYHLQWLSPTMNWLCEAMKRERDQIPAIIAIARVLPIAKFQAEAWLDSIVMVLHSSLTSIKRTSALLEALLELIAGCANAFGPSIETAITLCMDAMFTESLTPALVKAARAVAVNIPGLASTVRLRLLDLICNILSGTTFQDLTVPQQFNRRASIAGLTAVRPAFGHERRRSASLLVRARTRSASPMRGLANSSLQMQRTEESKETEIEQQAEALRYLGSFDFGHQPLLLGYFQQHISPLLSSPDIALRSAAVQACCSFLVKSGALKGQEHNSSAIRQVIQAVLLVGVADENPHLRSTALEALGDESFDKYLVEHERVRMLVCALNDEVSDVRLAIIKLLARTAPATKAVVLPSLRTELTGLLTILEQTPQNHSRQQILTVIVHIIDAAPSLADLYSGPIISVLEAQLSTAEDEGLLLAAFSLTQRVARHAGPALKERALNFAQYTCMALRDQASTAKRRSAVLTLTDIVAGTACMSDVAYLRDEFIDLLIAHLAVETDQSARRDTVKALGMLGASRPSLSGDNANDKLVKDLTDDVEASSSADSLESGLISTDPEIMRVRMPLYIADWVLGQLMGIWRDPGLKEHHIAVADAVMRIFRHEQSRARSWHYIEKVIPRFVEAINDRTLDSVSTCFYISALGKIARVAEARMEEDTASILAALMSRWEEALEPVNCIIDALMDLFAALRGGFQRYLPLVIPRVCAELTNPSCHEATITASVKLLHETAHLLRDWIHLIIPALLAVAEYSSAVTNQVAAMNALVSLSCSAHIAPHMSRILPVMHRLCLQSHTSDHALRCLCAIVKECGKEAASFVQGFERHTGLNIFDNRYYRDYEEGSAGELDAMSEDGGDITEVPGLNVFNIVAAFKPPDDEQDWTTWLQNLTTSVIKTSNNHHVRASAPVAEAYLPLQKKLLNYATYTDWIDLPEAARSEICEHICSILRLEATLEVHDMVLHLVDFMSRMGINLPIPPKLCKETSSYRCFLHRACRYAEQEYMEAEDESVISDLLKIHHDFQTREPDHALGLLQLTTQTTVEWAELGQWHATLQAYDSELAKNPDSHSAIRGVSRCLHALQEWDILLNFGDTKVSTSDLDVQQSVAPLMASAAWSVNRFDTMEKAITIMTGPERAWYAGVLDTIGNDLPAAQMQIDSARDMLCRDLVAMGATRSGRAYDLLVRTQLLTELEEAGRYRMFEAERPLIKERWTHRLANLQKEIGVIQRCLKIHSLAIPPAENAKAMTKYARLCRKAGRNDLAHKVLASTIATPEADPLNLHIVSEDEYAGLTLERCCLTYDFGDKDSAKEGLRNLVIRLGDRLDAMWKLSKQGRNLKDKVSEETTLLARCLHTLGDYVKGEDKTSLSEAQAAYQKSTDLEPTTKGLRKLASINLQIMHDLEKLNRHSSHAEIVELAVSVIDCYAQIIQKSPYYPLQDILGILTTVFKYGQHAEAVAAGKRAFETLAIDCWLEAIPQLTAQLNHPSRELQPIIEKHMQRLARAHPQTMLSSLAAVAQYPSKERAAVANRLLNVMRLYDDTLVSEALLVNHELRKCSMSPEEVCIVGVERASKYLFGEDPRNPVGMIKVLEDMCEGFEEPTTVGELDFKTKHGEHIRHARDLGKRYLASGNEKDLASLWKKWHSIHKACAASVKESPMSFNLAEACPRLAKYHNMKYAVPGTAQRHFAEDINIARFNPVVEILSSKQRPRKLTLLGDDGKEYKFLLKGREDLRLDERCVQFFTLVNHLLSRDHEALKRHLRMVKYAVIPLSHDAGLLSWFERGDTLHTIVRQHRKMSGIAMDAELKLTSQISPNLLKGTLSSMQQIEIFERASECSKGDEIYSLLWRKSASTSAWLDRRTNYSRSLAVSSMVGHVLGLGDRHPSNVLMDRCTGEIVQIDYGDAFEAAQERDSFPERVPFRCTRQLVNALPITGVEGLFRLTSQLVMKIMRDNQESIEAVFSSFVHDPLIQHLVLNPRQLIEEVQSPRSELIDEVAQIGTPETHLHTRRRKNTFAGEETVTSLSPRAQRVVQRVKQKLEGLEFGTPEPISVEEQVSVLISQATDPFNLSVSYGGWCPWW